MKTNYQNMKPRDMPPY